MTDAPFRASPALGWRGSSRDPANRGPRRILVVDDEPYIVDLVASLLADEGFVVDRAFDGEEAWQLASHHQPDLVISDISMPRLSGFDLLRRLRAERSLSLIPVILMSAVAREVLVGDATFLAKPFDIDRMLDLVEAELATG